MTATELGNELRRLIDERGLSVWVASRRANVKEALVLAALNGSGSLPVAALFRLAHSLDKEITLTALPQRARVSGPVENVVARALRGLGPTHDVFAFISDQRTLMTRLEEFARTPGFVRLQETIKALEGDDASAWLGAWLVQASVGLGGLPIDIALEPNGIDRLDTHLRRISLNPGGAI